MPNWCEGNIRFRGKQKDIKRFLMNEIVYCMYGNYEIVEQKPIIEDKDYMILIQKPEHSWFYIKDTRRNFFETDMLEIWIEEDDPEKETIICIDDYRVAWSFEKCEAWNEIVKKYNFDVKMTGYERGTHFSQVKTILRDGTVKDEIHDYENNADWMWNCPDPNKGG